MTLRKTLKKFKELKKAILEDKKVDMTEAEVLLDFISPYAQAGNKIFMDLHSSLLKTKEDGVITEDESKELIDEIELVSLELENERKVDVMITLFIAALVIVGTIYALL